MGFEALTYPTVFEVDLGGWTTVDLGGKLDVQRRVPTSIEVTSEEAMKHVEQALHRQLLSDDHRSIATLNDVTRGYAR